MAMKIATKTDMPIVKPTIRATFVYLIFKLCKKNRLFDSWNSDHSF